MTEREFWRKWFDDRGQAHTEFANDFIFRTWWKQPLAICILTGNRWMPNTIIDMTRELYYSTENLYSLTLTRLYEEDMFLVPNISEDTVIRKMFVHPILWFTVDTGKFLPLFLNSEDYTLWNMFCQTNKSRFIILSTSITNSNNACYAVEGI